MLEESAEQQIAEADFDKEYRIIADQMKDLKKKGEDY